MALYICYPLLIPERLATRVTANMSTSSIPSNDYHGGQSRLSRASPTTKNEYFVPGYGISRQVIVEHIQLFLGPGSSARPYSYLGREGFLILTSGKPLTKVRSLQSPLPPPPLPPSPLPLQKKNKKKPLTFTDSFSY